MAPDDAQPAPTEQEPVDYKKQYESALRAGEKATRAHEATQTLLNSEKHAHESALSLLNSEKQAHETTKATIETLKSEIKNLSASLGQRDGTLTKLQEKVAELEPAKAKAMRLGLILAEFPQLASFEKDGLLPSAETPELLRESLTKFSDRLTAVSKANEANFASGGKPENVPAPEQKKSSADLAKAYLDAAVQAQRSGNMAEYETNFSKFLQEKNKQQV